MNRHKICLSVILGMAFCIFSMANAFAQGEPNDNYSSFVMSYQHSTFANPVCVGTDCHTGLSGPALIFSHLIAPNFALGLAGSSLQSNGNSSTLKSTGGSIFLELIAGMGSSVDVGAAVAAIGTTLQACLTASSLCTSADDTGADIGVFGKIFLNDLKSLSLALSYDTFSFQKSATRSLTVGVALTTVLAEHHRLNLSADKTRDSNGNPISSGLGFGYSYLF
jgi:hypothetical protein